MESSRQQAACISSTVHVLVLYEIHTVKQAQVTSQVTSNLRHKRRQAAMLVLWAALVFISVSYMCHAPTLEYSEPGALAKPLWAARAFALETTMVGPVAMWVRHQ